MIRIPDRMACQSRAAIVVVTRGGKIIPTFKRICRIRDGVSREEAGEGRGFE